MKRKLLYVTKKDIELEEGYITKAGTPVIPWSRPKYSSKWSKPNLSRYLGNVKFRSTDTGLDKVNEQEYGVRALPLYDFDYRQLKKTYVSIYKYRKIMKSFKEDWERPPSWKGTPNFGMAMLMGLMSNIGRNVDEKKAKKLLKKIQGKKE